MAALEAHDDVGLLRQPVDDLALPLVAPLGADDDNIGHYDLFLRRFTDTGAGDPGQVHIRITGCRERRQGKAAGP
jgi:hypothetical protein